jgi:hypothetical protein
MFGINIDMHLDVPAMAEQTEVIVLRSTRETLLSSLRTLFPGQPRANLHVKAKGRVFQKVIS